MDKLIESAYFIPVKDRTNIDQLSQAYVREIVRLYKAPKTIVSDRDMRFVSTF